MLLFKIIERQNLMRRLSTGVLIVAILSVMIASPVMASTWYISATNDVGLTNPPEDPSSLNWVGTFGPKNTGGHYYASITCDWTDCFKADFYIEVTVSVEYSDLYGHAPYSLEFAYKGSSYHYQSVVCETIDVRSPERRTCQAKFYGFIPADEVVAKSNAVTVRLDITGNNEGTLYSEIWTVDVTISSQPIHIDNCDDLYEETGTIGGATIDPTDEDGDQLTTLAVGQLYKLTISGGPWISGDVPGTDRYDTAVKFGDDDWTVTNIAETGDYVQCVQNAEEDVHTRSLIFEAQDSDFAIRVNDLVGMFSDNSYPDEGITWEIVGASLIPTGSNCASQFLQGSFLGSYVLDATNSSGERITVPAPGKWVQVYVHDDTYWQNNGAGDQLTDMAIKRDPVDLWFPLDLYPMTECVDTDAGLYYFQVGDSTAHYLRVGDVDGNWPANTGSLTVDLYSATYDPFPTDCESHFAIGTQVETKIMSAGSSVGETILDGEDILAPFSLGGEMESEYRYIVIETINGPFWDGETYSAAADVFNGVAWYSTEVLPTALCTVQLDGMGRTRVYIRFENSMQGKSSATPWKFRAHDAGDGYGNNRGYIGYTLYYASWLDVNDCSDYYSHDPSGVELTIDGNDSVGVRIPNVQAGTIYVLETSGGPWLNDGAPSYDIALSGDNGSSWESYQASDLFLCKDEAGNYVTGYFKALEGRRYRIRADDTNFEDNSGSITVTIYISSQEFDPWASCGDNYTLQRLDNIPENNRVTSAGSSSGLQLLTETGKWYAIEIDENQWTEIVSGTSYRKAEISTDRDTWVPFQELATAACSVIIPDPNDSNLDRYRIYFAASGAYYVRADNQEFTWGDNVGVISLIYYSASEESSPSSASGLPPQWGSACYEPCFRPPSLFALVTVSFGTLGSVPLPLPDIAGWIEYARCAIQKFLAWCPEHTAALTQLTSLEEEREPIATMKSLSLFYNDIKDLYNSYDYVGGGESFFYTLGGVGGEKDDVPSEPLDILLPQLDRGNNPWFGGEVDLTYTGTEGGEPSAEEYSACNARYARYLGEGASTGMCEFIYLYRRNPFFQLVTGIFDVFLAGFLAFKYLPRWGQRLWNLLFKNRSTIGKLI
jgi:hypothetical protein